MTLVVPMALFLVRIKLFPPFGLWVLPLLPERLLQLVQQFFLLFAQLTFFTQMGILILSTIISSLIYSLFFFVPLLYVMGPQANNGNLRAIQHYITDTCCSSSCCSFSRIEAPTRELIKSPPPAADEDEKEPA
mmetsp:Transcript_11771/g.14369  ORF Transcript_11771/g.14369 Transcript_11771/m.14369 type:complete len:133 (+) Transcript_11771:1972-2370(+)